MIIRSPENIALRPRYLKSVFLAGSIEMGIAEDWQEKLGQMLVAKYTVFNPRRKEWDASWKQSYDNPNFYQQVKWELNALEKSDHILMYFDRKTKSPISLLELGLYATSKKLIIICEQGFWKRGNIEIICSSYDIPLFESIADFLKSKILI